MSARFTRITPSISVYVVGTDILSAGSFPRNFKSKSFHQDQRLCLNISAFVFWVMFKPVWENWAFSTFLQLCFSAAFTFFKLSPSFSDNSKLNKPLVLGGLLLPERHPCPRFYKSPPVRLGWNLFPTRIHFLLCHDLGDANTSKSLQ